MSGDPNTFADLTTATRMRDAIQGLIRQVLRVERPPDTYAVVQSINRTTRKAVVRFAGEDADIELPMGALQPLVVGNTVRVVGSATDRHIDEPTSGSGIFVGANSITVTDANITTLSVAGDLAGVAARFSRTNAPALGGIFHGLEIGTAGTSAGQIGLMFGPASMQAKNGSAASTFDINPSGGTVKVGGVDISSMLGAWTTFTPTLTQGVTVSKTTTYSRTFKLGRLVIWAFSLAPTSAGTGSSAIELSYPFTPVDTGNNPAGVAQHYNGSTSEPLLALKASTGLRFQMTNSSTGGFYSPAAIGSGHSITGICVFESTT